MDKDGKFAKFCQKIIAEKNSGILTIVEAATKIRDYPSGKQLHPMLDWVGGLAWELAEDFRKDGQQKSFWTEIEDLVSSYVNGNWHDTSRMLLIIYGKYQKDKLIESFSVTIRAQNGVLQVSAANEELKRSVSATLKTINKNQTDCWLLRNLGYLIPKTIGDLKLVSVDDCEYLVQV